MNRRQRANTKRGGSRCIAPHAQERCVHPGCRFVGRGRRTRDSDCATGQLGVATLQRTDDRREPWVGQCLHARLCHGIQRHQTRLHGRRAVGRRRKERLDRRRFTELRKFHLQVVALCAVQGGRGEALLKIARERAAPIRMMAREPPGSLLEDRIWRVEQRNDLSRLQSTIVHLVQRNERRALRA